MASHTTPSTQPSVPHSALDAEPLLVSETLIPPITSIQANNHHSNTTPTSLLLDDTHSSFANGPIQDNHIPSSCHSFTNALSSNGSILDGTHSLFANSDVQNADRLLRSTFTNTLSSNVSLGSTHSSFANSPVQDNTSSPYTSNTKSLVRHEMLLSPAREVNSSDGPRSLPCDEMRPPNILTQSNNDNTILLEVDETARTLDKLQNIIDHRVQVQSPRSSNVSTPPPSTDSNFEAARVRNDMPNGSTPIDVFFVQTSKGDGYNASHDSMLFALHSVFPPMPPNSKASFFSEEEMPLLIPSHPYAPPTVKTPPDKPRLGCTVCDDIEEGILMLSDETSGTMSYTGLSCADGKTTISFEGLTHSQAEHYLLTSPLAQYIDYHSVYIPNVIYAIESYCFCQDQIIANNWNVHLFRDGTYPGHPVIPGHVKLPTGGPRLGWSWQERVSELCDHL
ncbi:hypothetical protein P692DRAFT_20819494 [Suillus brevipes Sb2]|nr:hypothetical protein P692DRAFT_20819494 [Suillus brevipes Sb2]